MRNKRRGFTLLELLITLAIAGIVLAIGVPALREMLWQNRLTAHTNEFLTALAFARSEAIKRGRRVTLCKSSDGANCSDDGGYEQGWIVFIGPTSTSSLKLDNNDQILRLYQRLPTGMKFTGNKFVGSYISFTSDGFSRLLSGGFQAGTLTITNETSQRQLVINSMGRVRVAQNVP